MKKQSLLITLMLNAGFCLMIAPTAYSQDPITREWVKQGQKWELLYLKYQVKRDQALANYYKYANDPEYQENFRQTANYYIYKTNQASDQVYKYHKKLYERQNYIPHVKKRLFQRR